jgi:hypothetical protein
LYEFQLTYSKNNEDINWIKEIIKKGSYEESYDMFLEKASLLTSDSFAKSLKKSYQSYCNARRRKTVS